jgi:hypothetical protein
MTFRPAVLEGIARDLWESIGSPLPVDAFRLAEALGFEVQPWPKSFGARVGTTIRYPMKVRLVRQHRIVAHEVSHWGCEQAGLDPQCEESADRLASSLMLPRSPFVRDMDSTDYDLFELARRHPNCSHELIIVRMTQVSPATASVWDAGKLHRCYGAELVDDYYAEAALVDRVLETEAPLADGALRAWPVFDGRWRRVIVVRLAA